MLLGISRVFRRGSLHRYAKLVVANNNYRKTPSPSFFSHTESPPISSTAVTMAGETAIGGSGGAPLQEIVDALDRFAPPAYAESWDNVGLLIEPTGPLVVRRLLLTNDLTESVLQEALALKANLIVSYHPPIFSPLKRITSAHWKERIVATCLENRIAVYSPHTAWDAVQGGVADWLAEAFQGHYDESSVIPIVSDPTTEPQNGNCNKIGMGRILHTTNLTVQKCVELVKRHTGLVHVRLSIAHGKLVNSPVNTIALVPGSGGSLLKSTSGSSMPDLFLTGEMLHHDVLEAAHKGVSIILTNHSDSERGFLRRVMVSKLRSAVNAQVDVVVSSVDRDPLMTV